MTMVVYFDSERNTFDWIRLFFFVIRACPLGIPNWSMAKTNSWRQKASWMVRLNETCAGERIRNLCFFDQFWMVRGSSPGTQSLSSMSSIISIQGGQYGQVLMEFKIYSKCASIFLFLLLKAIFSFLQMDYLQHRI